MSEIDQAVNQPKGFRTRRTRLFLVYVVAYIAFGIIFYIFWGRDSDLMELIWGIVGIIGFLFYYYVGNGPVMFRKETLRNASEQNTNPFT